MRNLQLSIIILVTSPIFIQTSFASDSTLFEKTTLYCENNYYEISYQISNATVSNVTAPTNFQLTFTIQNSKNGIMNIEIPRNILRESIPNSMGYIPYVDGHYMKYADRSNSTHLIHTFVLPDGNFKLEFDAGGYPETIPKSMNCSVVPEFGSLAVLIATISFIGIIIMSRKFYMK